MNTFQFAVSSIMVGITVAQRQQAAAKFEAEVKERGGTVVGTYSGRLAKVECKCAKGHMCMVIPKSLLHKEGQQLCKICSKKCPAQAAAQFYVIELGGQAIGRYVNTQTPVECVCAFEHTCYPRPNMLTNGRPLCPKCGPKQTPEENCQELVERVHAMGGSVIGPWVPGGRGIACICSQGHPCTASLGGLRRGHQFCNECNMRSLEGSASRLRNVLDKLGYHLDMYVRANKPAYIICPRGHGFSAVPTRIRTFGICCPVCYPKTSIGEQKLKEALTSLGWTFDNEFPMKRPTNKHNWRFDYCLPAHYVLIEFDGLAHFIDFRKGSRVHTDQQRDIDKLSLALQNKYRMIRFDYTWRHMLTNRYVDMLQYAMTLFQVHSEWNLIVTNAELYQWILPSDSSFSRMESNGLELFGTSLPLPVARFEVPAQSADSLETP
jgi:hypothetical protein